MTLWSYHFGDVVVVVMVVENCFLQFLEMKLNVEVKTAA